VTDEKIRWGVLGAARIAHDYVIPAINLSANGRVTAIASRSESKLSQFSKEFGIEDTFLTYEDMLDSADIDAVYIPLPNNLHHRWTIEAARRKKHILCEKPAALNVAQCKEMISTCESNGVLFMEGYMYRFHPQFDVLKDEMESGIIGKILHVRSAFWFKLEDLSDIRYQKETGGGALFDLGCYCVSASRLILGSEPSFIEATSKFNEMKDVDEITIGMMKFPGSKFASFDCGFLAPLHSRLYVIGGEGLIEMPEAFEFPQQPRLVVFKNGSVTPTKIIKIEQANAYKLMVEHFADCILHNKSPLYDASDALRNMMTLENILASSRSKNSESMKSQLYEPTRQRD
jgi:predicted dehydrogenase